MTKIRVVSSSGLQQQISDGKHVLVADEPSSAGGDDAGLDPYSLLLAALGACTSMTLKIYAEHKKWNLDSVNVELTHQKIHAEDCANCDTKEGKLDYIERRIELSGDLTTEQKQRLHEIARRCPVHRTLTSEIKIVDL